MKQYLAVFIFLTYLINPLTLKSQNGAYQLSHKTDSLIRYMSKGLLLQERIAVLGKLQNEETSKRIEHLKAQLAAAEGNEPLELELNLKLGRESKWTGNVYEAYQYFTRTLFLAEKLEDNRTIAIASMELGNNIRLGSVNERPYKPYFERAVALFENIEDPLSKSYMLYAKLLLEEDRTLRESYINQAIGLLKANLDRSDSLLMESLATHLNVIASYQQEEQAFNSYKEALSVAREVGNARIQAFVLNNMGYNFLIKQEYDKAIPYHLQALDVAMQAGIKNLVSNALNNLYRCYREKGMYKQALDYYTCFFYLQSDINSDQFYSNMAELEVEHEMDRVELQNDLLRSEQKLQGRQQLILIIILSVLLLIVAFVIWSRRRVKKTNEKLQVLDKTKSRFFANISHELRTPLTLINAPLESLIHSGEIESPTALQTLKTATRNGVSLLSLVEEILDLAKLDGGKLQLVENPVRVNDFLTLILSDYKSGLDRKSIKLNYEYRLKEDLAILIDERRCTKVINNLLSNALKFTPEGGSISVVVAENNSTNGLQITVRDTGIGIHPNDLPHVFDRYFQSNQQGKKAEGGTGIGLALAKELAELHGGSLSVTSELEVGTSFIFELPIRQVLEETIVPISTVEDQALGQALTSTVDRYIEKFEIDKPVLLITEDHPEMRAFIAQTLAPYFDIRQAENGKKALEVLNSERIDIVISDVMMPVMDGFELLEAIKKDEALHQVSLIMLTARADHDDKLYALTLGIDDYLTKPFNASEFLARIKNILENRIKIIRELNEVASKEDLAVLIKRYQLVEREVEVLKLLAKRFSNPQIAEALHISRNTVKYHVKNIFGKMGLKTRDEAIDLVKVED